MEASQVNDQLKYLVQNATTLNQDERMQLTYALKELHTALKFETLYFWGKISGTFKVIIVRHFKGFSVTD